MRASCEAEGGEGRWLPRSRKVQKPRAVQAIASSFLAPEKSN